MLGSIGFITGYNFLRVLGSINLRNVRTYLSNDVLDFINFIESIPLCYTLISENSYTLTDIFAFVRIYMNMCC